MMKARIRKPAAKTDRANVIQYETSTLRIIRYHSTKYGISVFATCHKLRRISGLAYFATIVCQRTCSASVGPFELLFMFFYPICISYFNPQIEYGCLENTYSSSKCVKQICSLDTENSDFR